MALLEQIDADLSAALKAGNSAAVSTLRLLKNSLKNRQIETRRELSEAEGVKILQKEAKQRRDSIESFTAAGRDDLVKKETAELKLIETYLPKQMGETELEVIVDTVISETGATGMADMGKVMGLVTKQTAGQADGGLVAKVVRERLSNS